jgi:hypothetical protein
LLPALIEVYKTHPSTKPHCYHTIPLHICPDTTFAYYDMPKRSIHLKMPLHSIPSGSAPTNHTVEQPAGASITGMLAGVILALTLLQQACQVMQVLPAPLTCWRGT